MQSVEKKMFDKELRSLVGPLRFLSYLISKRWGVPMVHKLFAFTKGSNIKGLHCEERFISSKNGGPDIRIRIFRPNNDETLPAMLYLHGGGYLLGIPEVALDIMKGYIKKRPAVIIAPDYRKGLNEGYPNGFNDCYDTLLWMKENAQELKINADKFVVAGHSAGGGLTAAVTLKACDTGDADIAFQMPIYPMIDHRQNTDSAKAMDAGIPVWNAQNSALGWKTYLQFVEEEVPAYASPSLGTNYRHLPPTVTFVGEFDPFKDETINYVEALKKENIPVKFELFKGAYHGFEGLIKKAAISKRANQFQFDVWAEYYDKYLK